MVLATGLAFFMLWFGGGGGLINMSYGMNAMVHNTSWVTAHFHLIFGGTVVIMYFAIAYAIWPAVLPAARRLSLRAQRLQLWLWFVGMMVMTLPWHYLGLQGQWRRVANFNYADPIIAAWGPWVVVSLVGGVILLASAIPLRAEPAPVQRASRAATDVVTELYATAVHPPARVPAALNGFRLWNVLVARADDPRLRLSDRAVLHRQSAAGSRAPRGRAPLAMDHNADPLDRPWRVWASVAIMSVFAFSLLFGFVLLPVMQGRAAGVDAFEAICRALGITPVRRRRVSRLPTRRRSRPRGWRGARI